VKNADYIKPEVLSLFTNPEKQEEACLWFECVLTGRISFIGSIKGKPNLMYLKYASMFNEIFEKEYFDVSRLFEYFLIFNSIVVIENNHDQGTGFYLKNYGLITAYHVTKCNDGFFSKVYNYEKYNSEDIKPEISTINLKRSNEEKDYAMYNHTNGFNDIFEIGDSRNLQIGDSIVVVGFPDFQKGDSPNVYEGKISGTKMNHFGKEIYTIDKRIVHGMSGGPVLDSTNKVIGIIVAGEDDRDEERSHAHGFIPISVLEDDY
jgi:RNA-directed DNA polymerase